MPSLIRELSLLRFNELYNTNDVNKQLEIFNQVVVQLFNHVPTAKIKPGHDSHAQYESKDLKYQKSLRDLAFKAYCENRSSENWKTYCKHQNKTKSVARKLKRLVSEKHFNDLDSKHIWQSLRKIGCLDKNNHISELDADVVSNYFKSCQSTDIPEIADESFYIDELNSLYFTNISVNDLYWAFTKVKSNAVGPDNIPIRFLKILLPYIDSHIVHIINTILTTSVFPTNWKTARIVPILKNGVNTEIENLRPISILPAFSKLVENIIKLQILQHITSNSLLNNAQHGFRDGHSTTTLLLEMTDTIRKNLNSNKLSILLSVDLAKAFDRIDHGLLLKKLLSKFHFSRSAFALMRSYLIERNQFVEIGGQKSRTAEMLSGVPQGSVLGPLLFTLFINDFCSSISSSSCKVFLYADDIFLLFNGERHYEDVLEAQINYTLSMISQWLVSNKLQVNVLKTKAMGFNLSGTTPINISMNNCPIKFEEHIKCLGVIIDSKLKFEDHINLITQRVNFSLRQLYNTNFYLPFRVRKIVAHALLMSHISYGLEVYSGTTMSNMHNVAKLVNKVLRYCYNFKRYEHCTPYNIKFFGCSFQNYVAIKSIATFYKVMKHRTPDNLANDFSFSKSRRNLQIIIPQIENSHFERSFKIRVSRCWNKLPPELKKFAVHPKKYKSLLVRYFAEIET